MRYEVGICIQTGEIVWINGPFPPGDWPDVNIALCELVLMLEGDERVVADSGYRGYSQFFDTPWRYLDNEHQKRRKQIVRARHETINRRFKEWKILKEVFRHAVEKHGVVFLSVANIVQVSLEEEPTWQVDYNDRINNDFNV